MAKILGRLFSSVPNLSAPKPFPPSLSLIHSKSATRLVSSATEQPRENQETLEMRPVVSATETLQNQETLRNQDKEVEGDDDDGYINKETGEVGGPKGPEPTRFGDWERNGRCSDF